MTQEPALNQNVRIIQYSTNPEGFVGLTGKIIEIIEPLYFIELQDKENDFPTMVYKHEIEVIK